MTDICSKLGFIDAITRQVGIINGGISPLSTNQTLINAINGSFVSPNDTLEALQQLYCATADTLSTDCFGICGNPDITGIGVRLSNYVQCFTNVLLVWFSPEDSNVASWSGTMLTMAVVIPALIQKRQGALTIYHATQVLNFATISSLANLVVAPMCTIWRPKDDLAKPIEDDLDVGFDYVIDDDDEEAGEKAIERSMRYLQRASVYKARALLSFALMAQVALQWTWAIYMFTSPSYSQTPCSPITNVMFFLHLFQVSDINHNRHFYIYPFWLLFHMGVTIFWGAILVQSSSPKVHPLLSRRPTLNSHTTDPEEGRSLLNDMVVRPIKRRIRGFPWNEPKRLAILLSQVIAAGILLALTVTTEVQAANNCILLGENQSWGFGQIAALLLGLIPIGVLLTALYTKQKKVQQDRLEAKQLQHDHHGHQEEGPRRHTWDVNDRTGLDQDQVPSIRVDDGSSERQSLRSRAGYSSNHDPEEELSGLLTSSPSSNDDEASTSSSFKAYLDDTNRKPPSPDMTSPASTQLGSRL